MVGAANAIAIEQSFFHWPLEFPDVFFPLLRSGRGPSGEGSALTPGPSPKGLGEGGEGGFDVILGDQRLRPGLRLRPFLAGGGLPWERIKLQQKEFFAARDPKVAAAPNKAAREQLIKSLPKNNPDLWHSYRKAVHNVEALSRFLRSSGRYPLTGRGDINTYAVFTEAKRSLLSPSGRVGCMVPTGIATDDTTRYFFQDLMDSRSLVSLYDFENKGIFPAVHSRMKFSLLTLTGPARPAQEAAEFVFFAHRVEDLREPERRFTLSPADIRLLNPNTRTSPVFRSRRDAELTKAIYRRVPVLVNEVTGENPWGVRFLMMFHMSNDSHLFRTREQLEAAGYALRTNVFLPPSPKRRGAGGEVYLPLYEAKMTHHFDHRWATYDGADIRKLTTQEKSDPTGVALPRYWVPAAEVNARLDTDSRWLIGFRRTTRTTDERTAIFSVIPRVGVGHSQYLVLPQLTYRHLWACLVASVTSFAFDFVTRSSLGGVNMNFFIVRQLPVLPPSTYKQPCPWVRGAQAGAGPPAIADWFTPRVLELVYTAWDLKDFADDVWREADEGLRAALLAQWEANAAETGGLAPLGRSIERGAGREGFPRPPFKWDEERRFRLRCELDAAFFHLYGIARDDVDYIMDTFPIVRRRDEERHGEYRTKRVILEVYDEMAKGRV